AVVVASRRHSSPPTTVHNKPTTQYPSTPGFISNHWYGRWGQVSKAAFFIAARPSTTQAIGNNRERAREQRWEHFKASVRAKVEHPFRVIKRQFGYTKVRYRGLAKNTTQVLTLFALSNLWMKRKQLLPAMGSVRL
ncbi:transposase, partial [Xanthomonas hortorum pv. hederae]|uniref:transposase n=1 Tax=Xanthomonas hortorum TaxID=56454 RepID=UPI001F307257